MYPFEEVTMVLTNKRCRIYFILQNKNYVLAAFEVEKDRWVPTYIGHRGENPEKEQTKCHYCQTTANQFICKELQMNAEEVLSSLFKHRSIRLKWLMKKQ